MLQLLYIRQTAVYFLFFREKGMWEEIGARNGAIVIATEQKSTILSNYIFSKNVKKKTCVKKIRLWDSNRFFSP
jgi:hypothetical protein